MENFLSGKKHLFFDLDETVTLARSPVAPQMAELLASLPHDIVIVSGGDHERIKTQLGNSLPIYVLAQNGNHATAPTGQEYWNDRLTDEEAREIYAHIEELKSLGIPTLIEHDCIENRGSQICFSIMGHNAPVDLKRKIDPDSAIRKNMLEQRPFVSDNVEVRIGGTTTFDYFRKGSHKGSNVARLIEQLGWNKEDSVYFGDKLMPGGNDEAVVGVIETVAVKDPDDTYRILKDHLD